LPNQR